MKGQVMRQKIKRIGEVVNNQVKKFIAESVSEVFLIGEYLEKLPATAWLSHALCIPDQQTAKRRRNCT